MDIRGENLLFPFLFGGTFIEALRKIEVHLQRLNFPSFSEGLSLRPVSGEPFQQGAPISLPFRRDFH